MIVAEVSLSSTVAKVAPVPSNLNQLLWNKRVPYLSTMVITRLVHQTRSQKGPFWGGCRPTIWIELDRSTKKYMEVFTDIKGVLFLPLGLHYALHIYLILAIKFPQFICVLLKAVVTYCLSTISGFQIFCLFLFQKGPCWDGCTDLLHE